MTLRCLYVDLDGTLLGANGSLLHDGEGGVSLLGLRAIEACHRAGVEVVIYSGRKRESCWHASRLLGTRAYIYEAGCGLVIDGEEDPALLGEWAPRDGQTTFELIDRSGAPALLLDHFGDQLEYHEPWHRNRDVSHLFRGRVDAFEAGALLAEAGLDSLRLLDNGAIFPPAAMPHIENPRAYHLIPASASKGRAVARHRQACGLAAEECIAVGDSREDLGAAPFVGHFWLVANALEHDPTLREALREHRNTTVAEGSHGAGVYEAVIGTLAAR